VFEFDNTITFTNPTQVIELVFASPGPIFPEPDEYRLQFYAAGELVSERRLHVVPAPDAAPSEPGGGGGEPDA